MIQDVLIRQYNDTDYSELKTMLQESNLFYEDFDTREKLGEIII